jgi:hypothetical protein
LLLFWATALSQLGTSSLWYDELITADLVLRHTPGELLKILRLEQPYPPLYYLLLKGWRAFVGIRPYAPGLEPISGLEYLLRFPSIAAGLLALAVLAVLARALDLPGAPLTPLLVCVHPMWLWFARDARLYTFWILGLLLALYALATGRRGLWLVAASATALTHYFSLFPLAGGALLAWLFRPPWRRRLPWLGAPFILFFGWGLLAYQVSTGFSSFATGGSPSLARFLRHLGPALLTGTEIFAPLDREPAHIWGYALLGVGLLGWLLTVIRAPRRAGVVGGALFLGVVGTFLFWQWRPVDHVRYLAWALPLLALGWALVVTAPLAWLQRRARLALALIALPALIGGALRSQEIIHAERTTWYPDFRAAVSFLNSQADAGDHGVALAGHARRVFAAYGSPVVFEAGPEIGARLTPVGALDLIDASAGRQWMLLYQDAAVDPGRVLQGTLERSGAYRSEMFYSRELRLFAYTLPEGAEPGLLAPEIDVGVVFADAIALRGAAQHREGQLLVVYLFWELLAPQAESLTGAVHLAAGPDVPPIAQHDKPVLSEFWKLPRLPTGEVLPDRYELILPSDLSEGTYQLYALLYEKETGTRRVTQPDRLDRVPLLKLALP